MRRAASLARWRSLGTGGGPWAAGASCQASGHHRPHTHRPASPAYVQQLSTMSPAACMCTLMPVKGRALAGYLGISWARSLSLRGIPYANARHSTPSDVIFLNWYVRLLL